MRTITLAEAMRGLEWAVTENGEDFVYPRNPITEDGPSCVYLRDGDPDCLVGMALHHLGVPTHALKSMNLCGMIGEYATLRALHAADFELEAEALHALEAAQNRQDNGSTWGVALQAAKDCDRVFKDPS